MLLRVILNLNTTEPSQLFTARREMASSKYEHDNFIVRIVNARCIGVDIIVTSSQYRTLNESQLGQMTPDTIQIRFTNGY